MKIFGRPLELVILDVDGVILDLMKYFQQNLETTAKRFRLPCEPIRKYFKEVHDGIKHNHTSIRDSIKTFWTHLSTEERSQYVACFQEEERNNSYPAIEGSKEAILWFRNRNIPVALCTANDRAGLFHRLTMAGVRLSWFTTFNTKDDTYPKPDPRALDSIFDSTMIKRNNAVFVGDWYPDLEVTRGADVEFIAVLSGVLTRETFIREGTLNDHIIDRLSDIRKLIQLI